MDPVLAPGPSRSARLFPWKAPHAARPRRGRRHAQIGVGFRPRCVVHRRAGGLSGPDAGFSTCARDCDGRAPAGPGRGPREGRGSRVDVRAAEASRGEPSRPRLRRVEGSGRRRAWRGRRVSRVAAEASTGPPHPGSGAPPPASAAGPGTCGAPSALPLAPRPSR